MVGQVSDGHAPIGKETVLRCFSKENEKAFVSRVFLKLVDDIHHGFLLAFEDLQKGATLIEEHPRNAKLGIGFTGFYQQCFKLSFGEEL